VFKQGLKLTVTTKTTNGPLFQTLRLAEPQMILLNVCRSCKTRTHQTHTVISHH